MTKGLKSLRVLGTNFMICIGAGHGFGPMILLEFFAIENLLFNRTSESFYTTLPSFSFINSYEDMLVYFILFSSLGQIILLISYVQFLKIKVKIIIRFSGIMFMVFGFFLISKNLFIDSLAIFSFITGLPFLYFVIMELKTFSND